MTPQFKAEKSRQQNSVGTVRQEGLPIHLVAPQTTDHVGLSWNGHELRIIHSELNNKIKQLL